MKIMLYKDLEIGSLFLYEDRLWAVDDDAQSYPLLMYRDWDNPPEESEVLYIGIAEDFEHKLVDKIKKI